MCKCLETGGDEFDNTVMMICGHRPECPEFKIDKFSFAANIHAEAQKIADRIMEPERTRLKLLMETYVPKKSAQARTQISESNIQTRMFHYLNKKGHRWICPNFTAFSTGEMDICSVMKSGLVNEYEIKISRSDFRADLKKEHKHPVFQRIIETGEMIERRPSWNGGILELEITAPNFFHYVVPTDMVKLEEVPAYAGLIYVNPKNLYDFRSIKKAVKIHREPLSMEKKYKIAESLMWRFWNMKEKTLWDGV